MTFTRQDRDFTSQGLRCATWLYLPENASGPKPPVVVMAHGFAAERTFRLPAFAERFADAGLAVVLFDYRNLGDSEGEPRALVDPDRHVEDWRAAVAHARSLPEVDGTRLGLWGSSFSGGHVMVTAAADHEVSCIVAQVPYVGGVEVSLPLPMQLRAGVAILADKLAALFGAAVYVPAVGGSGRFGCMMAPEAREYLDLVPRESHWQNRVAARVLLEIPKYQPREHAPSITCPALVVVGERDETTPPDLAKACAESIPGAELAVYDYGHFEVYFGEGFEKIVTRERDFLVKHLMGESA